MARVEMFIERPAGTLLLDISGEYDCDALVVTARCACGAVVELTPEELRRAKDAIRREMEDERAYAREDMHHEH